jgi:hypothetical protein
LYMCYQSLIIYDHDQLLTEIELLIIFFTNSEVILM